MGRVKSITRKYFSWPLDTSATDLEILNETVSRAADLRAAYFVHATSINPRPHYISRYLNPRPAARHLLKLVSRRQPIPQEQIASRLLLHLAPTLATIDKTSNGNDPPLSLSLVYLAWVSLFYESFYLSNVQHHQGGLGHLVVWRVLAYNEIEIVQTLERYRATGSMQKGGPTKKIVQADASVIGTVINLVRGQ